MKSFLPVAASIAVLLATPALHAAEPEFPLTEDSKPHDNVPKGELIEFEFAQSKIFPGTTREVTVYVPKQYDGTKPACVFVNQDGVQWNAPVVFDNLIAKGEMPVTIGMFARPGVVKALDGSAALDRFNRSLEYDGLGPDYARFILEEVLPAVEQKTTSDGRKIVLSKNGNDRAIGGSSSGAIAAFTAAWEKPEEFSRVFNVVCTMVGLRGANIYPTLIRKYEPKAIRVFQQDGSNDNNIYGGDWWMANQELERALTFAGYEHDHVWGEGGHNGKHGTQVFPDAMRFLWKGWPTPVKAGEGAPQLKDILIPGENWTLVKENSLVETVKKKLTPEQSRDLDKELDAQGARSDFATWRSIARNAAGEISGNATDIIGHAFGPDGRLYAALAKEPKIVVFDSEKKQTSITDGIRGSGITVLRNGNLYVTEAGAGQVWVITPAGNKITVDRGLIRPSGVVASPDQSLLYVAEAGSHWVYSYQIQPDGTLAHKQRYYHLHVPDTADDAGAEGMEVDTAGRLYIATRLGLQVCDQAGRVNCIIPIPAGRARAVALGGKDMDTLYVTSGERIYQRKVKAKAAPNFAAPVKPAPPKL